MQQHSSRPEALHHDMQTCCGNLEEVGKVWVQDCVQKGYLPKAFLHRGMMRGPGDHPGLSAPPQFASKLLLNSFAHGHSRAYKRVCARLGAAIMLAQALQMSARQIFKFQSESV
jgi:hypothetical protein